MIVMIKNKNHLHKIWLIFYLLDLKINVFGCGLWYLWAWVYLTIWLLERILEIALLGLRKHRSRTLLTVASVAILHNPMDLQGDEIRLVLLNDKKSSDRNVLKFNPEDRLESRLLISNNYYSFKILAINVRLFMKFSFFGFVGFIFCNFFLFIWLWLLWL